jgi:pentatricopeptide repeat protein
MIVLDDAHELTGARAALAWTAALIEATPASVRFVIAARGESPFTRGRFARLGERTLDRGALAFNRTEARRLLERLRVPRPRRAALAARHVGWVTGLVAGARASDASASEWAILAARELDALEPKVRRDLLIASGLDDLDPEALSAALSPARSRRLLDTVRRRSLYVESGRGGAPRFHPLFQDVLRDLAARELPAPERQQALGRAAEHWRRQGRSARAILALAAAGQIDHALAAFERAWRENGPSARDALGPIAERWLDQGEPAGAAGRPAVLLAASRQDADGGRFDRASTRARAAIYGWLDAGHPLQAAHAYWHLTTVANHTVQFAPAIRDGLDLLGRLASGPDPTHQRRAAIAMVRARVGSLRLYAGDPNGAREDLDAALRSLAGRPNSPEYADTEVSRATLEFTAGRWEPYLMRTRRALAVYRRAGYWGRAHALLVNMAEGYTYLGEETVARAHLDEAAALADRSGSFARRALLEISRARTFSEEGAMRDAAPAFRVARRELARASVPLYEGMLDTWEGVFERRRGRLARAVRLLSRAEAGFARLESPSWQNVARLERALVDGLAGRTSDALGTLAECARVSRRLGDRKEEARAWLFAARVAQHAGRPYASPLRTALRLLDRENYPVLLRKERDVAEPLGVGPGARESGASVPVPRSRRKVATVARVTPARVRVRMLGGFALEVAGVGRPIARTAARQLVVLLALRRGRPERREALAERLWPGAPAEASRNRFDVALTTARRAIEPDAGPRGPFTILRGEGGMLWLDAGVQCDVDRFETLATQADRDGTPAGWQRAAAAYTGPLLPEWVEAEWTEDARERLRTRYARVLVAAARAALSRRDLVGAIDLAERALAEDPLDDSALAVMLDALVKAGRVSEAKRLFRRFVGRCEVQMAARPGPELVALAGELGIAEDR